VCHWDIAVAIPPPICPAFTNGTGIYLWLEYSTPIRQTTTPNYNDAHEQQMESIFNMSSELWWNLFCYSSYSEKFTFLRNEGCARKTEDSTHILLVFSLLLMTKQPTYLHLHHYVPNLFQCECSYPNTACCTMHCFVLSVVTRYFYLLSKTGAVSVANYHWSILTKLPVSSYTTQLHYWLTPWSKIHLQKLSYSINFPSFMELEGSRPIS
jgi:hypothetical protein